MSEQKKIAALQARVERLEVQLRTFIVWTAQSANSPISHHEAKELLDRIGLA